MLLSNSIPSLAVGLLALSTLASSSLLIRTVVSVSVITVTETNTVTLTETDTVTSTITAIPSCSSTLTGAASSSASTSSSSLGSAATSSSSTSSYSSATTSASSSSSPSTTSFSSSASSTSSELSSSSSSSNASTPTSSSSTSFSSSISSTISTSTSSTSSSVTSTSTAPASTAPGTYQGCWTEQSNVRTLLGTVFYNDQLTVEICVADCAGAGYTLAGVEYGRECWCGNSITPGAVQVADASCNMQCDGNSSEFCGGHGLLDIYIAGSLPSTATASASTSTTPSATSVYTGPTTVPSVGSCYFVGCYSEATNQRALTGASYYDYSATGMTVEKCAASCGSKYSLFGVEWSGECYCGNTLNPGSALQPVDQCQMLCDGDKTEYCGGSSRLDLYYCPPPPTTVTATSTIDDYISTAIATSAAATSTITVDTYTITETTTIATVTTCVPQAYKRQLGNGFTSTLASITTTQTVPLTEYLTYQSTTITTPYATSSPTVTVTSSVTYTSNVCPTPSSTCNNQGLQWAYYNNAVHNDDTSYSTFDPTIYKTQVPGYTGVTSTIGGINLGSNPIPYIYGEYVDVPLTYFALNHQGYFFAQLTGTYTFVLPHPDDIDMVWIGDVAYSIYNRGNAAAINVYGWYTQVTYTVNFVAGNYYPIRIMFGQAQGAAVFALSVIDPEGTTILSSDSEPSPYIVQYSCDGILAPPFPAWPTTTITATPSATATPA